MYSRESEDLPTWMELVWALCLFLPILGLVIVLLEWR